MRDGESVETNFDFHLVVMTEESHEVHFPSHIVINRLVLLLLPNVKDVLSLIHI